MVSLQPILPFVQQSLTGPRFVPLSINGVWGVTGRSESGRAGMRSRTQVRPVPAVSTRIAGLVDFFSFTFENWHEQLCTNEFLSGCLADWVLLNWVPFQRKEAMSAVVLEMVVSVAEEKGWSALYRVSELGSCQ